jgi:hypothetical protein
MTDEQRGKLAEKLIRENRMPSLEQLIAAVLETRMIYANQIRRARREEKESR